MKFPTNAYAKRFAYDTISVSSRRSVVANEFAPLKPSASTSFGIKARRRSLSFTAIARTGPCRAAACSSSLLAGFDPFGPGRPIMPRSCIGNPTATSSPSSGNRSSLMLIPSCFSIDLNGDSGMTLPARAVLKVTASGFGGVDIAAKICGRSSDIVINNSVLAGKIFGASGATGAAVIRFDQNGSGAFFSPEALMSKQRKSNDSPSYESARPIASGEFGWAPKKDSPSLDKAAENGSGVGVASG